MPLPSAISTAVDVLEKAGYDCWLVGGCVRDAVMGIEPHDYDITTSSTPEETIRAFSGYRIIETGIKHGTVTVIIDGEQIEITTFRVDGDYLDNRRPSSVSFTRSIEDDLRRRDFTINAMAYNPEKGLLDLFGGCEDIEKAVIACVGNAEERFQEDGLRILRALRFASRLGFSMEENTDRAVRRLSHLLCGISVERVFSELCGIICGAFAGRTVLEYADVISVFIPELREIIGFEQKSRYHCFDALEHTCRAIDASPQDRLVRLALLLHDIGKPQARVAGADGYDHYYGHQDISAQMADDILLRLKSDGRTRRIVTKIIKMHDRTIVPDEKRAKRLLRELPVEEVRILLEVKAADRLAHASGYNDPSEIYEMGRIVESIALKDECISVSALAIGGREIMELGVKPGPVVGTILERLLDEVINGKTANEKELLIEQAKIIIAKLTDGAVE